MECRMHRTIEFVRLQLQLFVSGSRCVVPTVVLAVFLYAMYSSKPVGIVSSFTISGYLSFFLMLWVGLRVSSTEDAVAEQIYLLRLEGSFWYYLGKVGFYCTVGVLLTLVCLAYPLLQNLVNAGGMFTRPDRERSIVFRDSVSIIATGGSGDDPLFWGREVRIK